MNIIEKLKVAISKNELKKFLEGLDEYNIPNREGFFNDNLRALVDGIYKYYQIDSNMKFLFENELLNMINGSEFDILTAFDYLRLQIISEVRNNAPFTLDKKVYIEMKKSIVNNYEKLQVYKSEDYTNNPAKYVDAMDNYMEEKYGRRIL